MIRLLFAIVGVAFAQSGTISGTVVEATGDPVSKAIVTLTWQGAPKSWATVRSDSSGHFKFDELPPGKYDLRATKVGSGTAIYGANSTRELGELISLADGEASTGLNLRFIHSSAVSGRILDPDGDPVPGAHVRLLRAGRNLGQRILVNYRDASSNDQGEYQITGVEPGPYYLRTTVNQNGQQTGSSSLLTAQYYGGAVESKDAVPIAVRSGESLTGLDFRLTAAPAVQIRGHLTGVPRQHNDPAILDGALFWRPIILTPVDDLQPSWRLGVTALDAEGHFMFPEVPAGRYRLHANQQVESKHYAASQVVDAQPGMGEIDLSLRPAAILKGQLVIEGKSTQKLPEFHVVLSSDESVGAAIGVDGKFIFDQIAAGEWEMNLNPVPRGGYIKSVHFGDKDVRFAKIPVEPGIDTPLTIVISMGTASIEGDLGSARAGILLAPVGSFHDLARFYYSVQTDGDGKFKMIGIAPGKYKVFALEKMVATNFRSAEAADQLGELGEEVVLAEGASVTVHPKLIPAERAREALP